MTLAVIVAPPKPVSADNKDTLEQFGDIAQIELPVIAGICALGQKGFPSFALGFVAQSAIVQGAKQGLGEIGLNARPNGSSHGFPSGHTSAAVYGSTNFARKCVPERPLLGSLAYGTAAVVGASRIAADKHNAAQVIVGAVVGYYANGLTVSAGPNGIGLSYSFDF